MCQARAMDGQLRRKHARTSISHRVLVSTIGVSHRRQLRLRGEGDFTADR